MASFDKDQNWFGRRKRPLLRVRLLGNLGGYPEGDIWLDDVFYHGSSDGCFLVTRGMTWDHYVADLGHDEFDWPLPKEVMLMGAMIMCERPDEPAPRFYPMARHVFVLDESNTTLTSEEGRAAIVNLVKSRQQWPGNWSSHASTDLWRSSQHSVFPSSALDLGRLQRIFGLLRPDQFVLMRGITGLIKSDMLARHGEFGAESLMSLYISMDCSHQLILQVLRDRGAKSPSSADAAAWLHENFDRHFGHDEPAPGTNYLAEFYQGRVVAFHPRSKFGDYPFAPNFWDDVIHLRRLLSMVFGYIVTGEHSGDFWADVESHRAKWL